MSGGDYGAVQRHILELSADMVNMPVVMDFIDAHTGNLGNPGVSYCLRLAGEEMAMNVFNYAYGGTPGKIVMSIARDPGRRIIVMELRDKGKPYNPLENDGPDITCPISERKMGGLGIMFFKKVTDRQVYAYDDGQNVLTVEKTY